MGDVDEGQADLLLDALELDLHLPAQLEVEGTERLVEEQDVGPVDQGPRQRDALLHATGELVRLLAAGVAELDEVEGVLRLGLEVLVTAAPQPEGDVVHDAHVREERVGLEHRVDVALVGAGRVMSVSPIRIWPAVGSSRPATIRRVVVLPQPEGPSRAKNEPCGMVRSSGCTAVNSPKRLGQPDQPEVAGLVLGHQLAVRSEKAREYLVSSSAVRPLKTLARERTSSLGKISGLSAVSGSSLARASLVPTTGGM